MRRLALHLQHRTKGETGCWWRSEIIVEITQFMKLWKRCKLSLNLKNAELLWNKGCLNKYYYQEVIFLNWLSVSLRGKKCICKQMAILSNSFRFWSPNSHRRVTPQQKCCAWRLLQPRAVRQFETCPLPGPIYHALVQSAEGPWCTYHRSLSEETESEPPLQIFIHT